MYSDPFCENIPKNLERELDSVITIFERALRAKDTNLLMSLMDSNIVSSHGGAEFGYEAFTYTWEDQLDLLWKKLETLHTIGGAYLDDTTFVYPYSRVPEHCIFKTQQEYIYEDAYITYFTLNDTVKMYVSPSRNSEITVKIISTFLIGNYDQIRSGNLDRKRDV